MERLPNKLIINGSSRGRVGGGHLEYRRYPYMPHVWHMVDPEHAETQKLIADTRAFVQGALRQWEGRTRTRTTLQGR